MYDKVSPGTEFLLSTVPASSAEVLPFLSHDRQGSVWRNRSGDVFEIQGSRPVTSVLSRKRMAKTQLPMALAYNSRSHYNGLPAVPTGEMYPYQVQQNIVPSRKVHTHTAPQLHTPCYTYAAERMREHVNGCKGVRITHFVYSTYYFLQQRARQKEVCSVVQGTTVSESPTSYSEGFPSKGRPFQGGAPQIRGFYDTLQDGTDIYSPLFLL